MATVKSKAKKHQSEDELLEDEEEEEEVPPTPKKKKPVLKRQAAAVAKAKAPPVPSPKYVTAIPTRSVAPVRKHKHQLLEQEPERPLHKFKPKHGKTKHEDNNVKKFLKQHPEFAEEFTRTIPISPEAQMTPPPSPLAAKQQKQQKQQKPQAVYDEDGHELEDQPLKLPPKKQVSEDEEPLESEEEPEEEYPEPEEEIEEEGEPEGEDSQPPEDEEAIDLGSGDEAEEPKSPPPQKKPVEEEPPKRPPEPRKLSEEEEAIEKMTLVEEIKEDAELGLMPPYPVSVNMPLKTLRQIRAFQEEMAAQAMHVNIMGTGLVGLISLVETLNGRFDPMHKVFGKSLKLQGARDKVEANIGLYKNPFIKLYKRMKAKGLGGELPPWVEISLITAGILKDVHMHNEWVDMRKQAEAELVDPEARRKAAEIFEARRAAEEARRRHEMDAKPYSETVDSAGKQPTDAELEKQMAEEFAGFDKLPDLSSIRGHAVPAEVPAAAAAASAAPATLTPSSATQTKASNAPPPAPAAAAAPSELKLVHPVDPSAVKSEAISMHHAHGETDEADAEEGEYGSELSEEEGEEPAAPSFTLVAERKKK